MSKICTSLSSIRSDLRVIEKSGRGQYVMVLGLPGLALDADTGRMMFQPCSATGPRTSDPEEGSRPIKPQAGSCNIKMSKSANWLLRSCIVAGFFLCMLS